MNNHLNLWFILHPGRCTFECLVPAFSPDDEQILCSELEQIQLSYSFHHSWTRRKQVKLLVELSFVANVTFLQLLLVLVSNIEPWISQIYFFIYTLIFCGSPTRSTICLPPASVKDSFWGLFHGNLIYFEN